MNQFGDCAPTVAETNKPCPDCNASTDLYNELGVYWWFYCPHCCQKFEATEEELEREFYNPLHE